MSLHGGVIPVCATFFAFSDYMKPVLRVAALMETPVKFLWTHDAFRVGEDGPTHQPIEQETQLRLLEKVKNHSGNASFIALRPADGPETVSSWQYLIEDFNRPGGLILSRQNIEQIPAYGDDTRYEIATSTPQGGYVAIDCEGTPDVILIANGSEVSTCASAIPILNDKGIKARLVSVPSEGLFRSQSDSYQKIILTPGVPRFGITAGLPVNLMGLVGENGKSFGLDHFGYSAPYTVLDEKFGFTAENVVSQVEALLG
jgi:transketolase